MVRIRTLSLLHVILVTEVILSSSSHPDCNFKKVVNQLVYLCNAYSTPYSSIKRETNSDDGFGPPNYRPPPSGLTDNNGQPSQQQQQQQVQTFQYPQDPGPGGQMAPQQMHPPSPSNSWQSSHSNPKPPSEGAVVASSPVLIQRRKERLHPVSDPNEPEDFASFNDYYLNPVYADADWQSSIERWRRDQHLNEEIYRFVRNKCCVTGCAFPDEYWELDKRINICQLR